MKFKGQVSKVWITVILLMNLVTIGIMIYNITTGMNNLTYVLATVLILMDLMICPSMFLTETEVGKKVFTVRYGFTTKTFLINDIVSAQPSTALFGTYAVGSDKIALKKINQEEIVLSLVDNKGFINELKKQNKKMKIFI